MQYMHWMEIYVGVNLEGGDPVASQKPALRLLLVFLHLDPHDNGLKMTYDN